MNERMNNRIYSAKRTRTRASQCDACTCARRDVLGWFAHLPGILEPRLHALRGKP